jgi:hypothetical protein
MICGDDRIPRLKGTQAADPTSSCEVVLMNESSQDVAPFDPNAVSWASNRIGLRRVAPETSMGSGLVVIFGVDADDSLEVTAADHQRPIQAPAPDYADPPLRVRVRAATRIGVLNDPRAFGP